MNARKKEFTLLECVMVVAIFLFVTGIAIGDLVHSVRVSEESTIHTAAKQYSTVRNMYAAHRALPDGASGERSTRTASVFDTPVR